jgi:hypothetical protein
MHDLPPNPADFDAALRRVESGLATADDAQIIRRYVAAMKIGMAFLQDQLGATHELLMREREASDRLQQALDEAFNSGPEAYAYVH